MADAVLESADSQGAQVSTGRIEPLGTEASISSLIANLTLDLRQKIATIKQDIGAWKNEMRSIREPVVIRAHGHAHDHDLNRVAIDGTMQPLITDRNSRTVFFCRYILFHYRLLVSIQGGQLIDKRHFVRPRTRKRQFKHESRLGFINIPPTFG